jgi:putative redox protein
MDAKVSWQGSGLAFEGTATRGYKLALGNGDDPGFSPLELLLVGLGGCTGMDVISILQKKRQDVTGFEIQLHADRAEDHPRVFTDVVVEYIFSGNGLDPAAVERAVDLSVNKYCSAQAMLSKAANITHKITIKEA